MKKVLTNLAFFYATVFLTWLLPPHADAASPSKLLMKGRTLLDVGQDGAALSCLTELVSREPHNAQAYYERSRALGMFEKYDEALKDSNTSISLNPKLAEAYANRAEIYIELNQYPKALSDISKAFALNPKLAIVYSTRALLQERLENYQKAVDDLNKAISIDRSCAKYYIHRAFAFRQLGHYQKTLHDLSIALSLTARKSGAYIERGYTYMRIGNSQKAMKDFICVTQIVPQSYYEYSLRAEAYGVLGQYQKQINDLTLMTKINPRFADIYEKRGYACYQLFQLENAIADCLTAIKLSPATTKPNYIAAAAYEEMGLFSKSLDLRTKILKLRPRNVAFDLLYRGLNYEQIGRLDLAQIDWQKAIKMASPSQRDEMMRENPLIDFENLNSSRKNRATIDKWLKDNSEVLQFRYDEGLHICVPLNVTGYRSEFMVDTGSTYTDICRQALFCIARKNNMQLRDLKAPGQDYLKDFFKVTTLKLGKLVLPNITLGICEDLYGSKALGGYLGGNILENFIVTVDYRSKQLRLESPQVLKPSGKAIIVPIRIRHHRPHCSVKVDGKLCFWALLDTGCPFSMSSDSLLEPVLSQKLNFKERIFGPELGDVRSESIRLKSLELGQSIFKFPFIDVFPAAEAPNAATTITLGNDFLSRFATVTFDYPARRLILEPNETESESAPQLFSRGRYFLAHNKPQLAADAFTKTMHLESEFAPACFQSRAKAFEQLKQYQAAIQDLSAQLEITPKNPWIFYHRARNYRLLAKYKLEIADDSTAISLAPKFKSAYLDRAWAFDKLGMKQLAEKDRTEAKKLP